MDRITEEKIKSAANVVEVIGDFIQLRKRGVEYQGLCPFHDDKTLGNFSVNPSKGVYKCFACGAGGDAIKFLMEFKDTKFTYGEALHYLAHKYSIPVDDDYDKERWKNIKPATPKQIIETHKDMLVMPRDVVKPTMMDREKNIFVTWLRHLPWNVEQKKRLDEVLWLYCVGHWKDGRVVFWQIDDEGRVHSGKLMRYGTNGKRDKDKVTGKPGWMHNQDGIRERCDMEHHEYRATLFGMHLMNRYPNATINIVESEKTALIMATAYGNLDKNLWLACGGLEFLKVEALRPLIDSGRRVWVWPDKDGVEKWKAKVGHLINDRFGIYTQFFDKYWIPEDGPKADLADINLRILTGGPVKEKTSLATENNEPSKPDGISDEDWNEHLKTMGAIYDLKKVHGDEPFLDPIEMIDPVIAERRRILSRVCGKNKTTI